MNKFSTSNIHTLLNFVTKINSDENNLHLNRFISYKKLNKLFFLKTQELWNQREIHNVQCTVCFYVYNFKWNYLYYLLFLKMMTYMGQWLLEDPINGHRNQFSKNHLAHKSSTTYFKIYEFKFEQYISNSPKKPKKQPKVKPKFSFDIKSKHCAYKFGTYSKIRL